MSRNGLFKELWNSIVRFYVTSSMKRYIKWLRKKGVKIGDNVDIRKPRSIMIDVTNPSLITIGNNVFITRDVSLLSHGFDWFVLRELYKRPFSSVNRITIGDNVFIGTASIILKGVRIGNNVIIGAGSVVTHDIPDNSVSAGVPAKVINSVENIYDKYIQREKEEAAILANAIKDRYNRDPVPEDFSEHFYLFLKRDKKKFGKIPVRNQVGSFMNEFLASEPEFPSFEAFLNYCYTHKYDDPFFGKKKDER